MRNVETTCDHCEKRIPPEDERVVVTITAGSDEYEIFTVVERELCLQCYGELLRSGSLIEGIRRHLYAVANDYGVLEC